MLTAAIMAQEFVGVVVVLAKRIISIDDSAAVASDIFSFLSRLSSRAKNGLTSEQTGLLIVTPVETFRCVLAIMAPAPSVESRKYRTNRREQKDKLKQLL